MLSTLFNILMAVCGISIALSLTIIFAALAFHVARDVWDRNF
jgi:hypothetical protein